MLPTIAVRLMDRNTLREKIYSGEKFHLWNVVPTESPFARKHLPRSRWVPANALEDHVFLLNIEKDEEIVVYSGGGACGAALAAAQRLTEMGYAKVYIYDGGLQDWVRHGLPYRADEGRLSYAGAPDVQY